MTMARSGLTFQQLGKMKSLSSGVHLVRNKIEGMQNCIYLRILALKPGLMVFLSVEDQIGFREKPVSMISGNLARCKRLITLVSILVQWAPNNRRSESQTFFLKAHVQGMTSSGVQVVASTGSNWKTSLSDAWNRFCK